MMLKRIRSKLLEKRLAGMRELEERIDVCERRLAIDPRTGTLAHPELQEETWINGAWLRDWILSERLVEDLFGDRMDVRVLEVASRSLVRFLAVHGGFSGAGMGTDHFACIWRAAAGRGVHESTRRAVYTCIIRSLVPNVRLGARVDFFWRHVASVSFQDYDEQFLDFVRDYTVAALTMDAQVSAVARGDPAHRAEERTEERTDAAARHDRAAVYTGGMEQARRELEEVEASATPGVRAADTRAYGVTLLWDFLQDAPSASISSGRRQSKPGSPGAAAATQTTTTGSAVGKGINRDYSTAKEALKVLMQLVRMPVCQAHRMRIVHLCVGNLQDGESVAQALEVLVRVLQSFPVISSASLSSGDSGSVYGDGGNATPRGNSDNNNARGNGGSWFKRQSRRFSVGSGARGAGGDSKEAMPSTAASNSTVGIPSYASRAQVIDNLSSAGSPDGLLDMFFDELRVYCSRVAVAMRQSGLRARTETYSEADGDENDGSSVASVALAAAAAQAPPGASESKKQTETRALKVGSERYSNEFRLPRSCYPHRAHVEARLSFLLFVLRNSQTMLLSSEHIEILWECLVTQVSPLTQAARNMCCRPPPCMCLTFDSSFFDRLFLFHLLPRRLILLQAVSRASRDLAFDWFCSCLDAWFVAPSSSSPSFSTDGEEDGQSRDGDVHADDASSESSASSRSSAANFWQVADLLSISAGQGGGNIGANVDNISPGAATHSSNPGDTMDPDGVSRRRFNSVLTYSVLERAAMLDVLKNASMIPSLRFRTLSRHGWTLFLRYFLVVNSLQPANVSLGSRSNDSGGSLRHALGRRRKSDPEAMPVPVHETRPALLLHSRDDTRLVRAQEDLVGIDQLWSIALASANPVIGDAAIKLLGWVHTSLSPALARKPVTANIAASVDASGSRSAVPYSQGAASVSTRSSGGGTGGRNIGQHIRIRFVENCLKHVVSAFNHATSESYQDEEEGQGRDVDTNGTSEMFPGSRSPALAPSFFAPKVPLLRSLSAPTEEKSWRCVERGVSLLSRFLTSLIRNGLRRRRALIARSRRRSSRLGSGPVASVLSRHDHSGSASAQAGSAATLVDITYPTTGLDIVNGDQHVDQFVARARIKYLRPKEDMSLAYSILRALRVKQRQQQQQLHQQDHQATGAQKSSSSPSRNGKKVSKKGSRWSKKSGRRDDSASRQQAKKPRKRKQKKKSRKKGRSWFGGGSDSEDSDASERFDSDDGGSSNDDMDSDSEFDAEDEERAADARWGITGVNLEYLSAVAQQYFDDLFRFFDYDPRAQLVASNASSAAFADNVWNILHILPVHERLAREMRALRLNRDATVAKSRRAGIADPAADERRLQQQPQPHENVFHVLLRPDGSACELLYSLRIIDGYISHRPRGRADGATPAGDARQQPGSSFQDPAVVHRNYPKWCRNLVQCDATQHLTRVLTELADQEDAETSPLRRVSDAPQHRSLVRQNSGHKDMGGPRRLLCLSVLFRVIHNLLAMDDSFSSAFVSNGDEDAAQNPVTSTPDGWQKNQLLSPGNQGHGSGSPLQPGVLVALTDLDQLVESSLRILVGEMRNHTAALAAEAKGTRRTVVRGSSGGGGNKPKRRSKGSSMKIGAKLALCVDCGTRLLAACAVSCPERKLLSKNALLLEEFLELALLRCPSRAVRCIAARALNKMCDVACFTSPKNTPGAGASTVEPLVRILLGRRFFDRVITERRRWLESDTAAAIQSTSSLRSGSSGRTTPPRRSVSPSFSSSPQRPQSSDRRLRFLQNSEQYWNTLCAALVAQKGLDGGGQTATAASTSAPPRAVLISRVAMCLMEQPCGETLGYGSIVDDVFVGLCRVGYVSFLGSSDPVSPLPAALQQRLTSHLWETCLFPVQGADTSAGSDAAVTTSEDRSALAAGKGLCISSQARQAAFMLLSQLIKYDSRDDVGEEKSSGEHRMPDVLSQLEARSVDWHELSTGSWHYNATTDTVSKNSGFVGLKNQGCTCYMNSLLQQLYHIRSFRQGLLRIHASGEADAAAPGSEEQQVLYQLQVLFGYLTVSQRSFYNTLPLCNVLRDPGSGAPLRLGEQKDVNEFCGSLFDLLERSSPQVRGLVQSHFRGEFVHEIISRDPTAPYVSTRSEPYFMITVPVKNKSTLEEGLESLTQGESLAGNNSYRLPPQAGFGEDKKVEATKVMTVKKLPPFLIMHLKRFDFDYATMERSKVNDSFSFPHVVDMYPYTHEAACAARNAQAAEESAHIGSDNVNQDDDPTFDGTYVGMEDVEISNGNNDRGPARTGGAGKKDDDETTIGETIPPAPVSAATRLPPPPKTPSAAAMQSARRSTGRDGDAANKSEAQNAPSPVSPELTPPVYEYRLRGVLAHTGTATSGHYYSFIEAEPREAEDASGAHEGIPSDAAAGGRVSGVTPSLASRTGARLLSGSARVAAAAATPSGMGNGTTGQLADAELSPVSSSVVAAVASESSPSRTRPKRWLEFNDTRVRPFSQDRMAEECFGGTYKVRTKVSRFVEKEVEDTDGLSDDDLYAGEAGLRQNKLVEVEAWEDREVERRKSAYLLVYERILVTGGSASTRSTPANSVATSEASALSTSATASVPTSPAESKLSPLSFLEESRLVRVGGYVFDRAVMRSVWEKNVHFLTTQQLYDPALGCRRFLWNAAHLVLFSRQGGREGRGGDAALPVTRSPRGRPLLPMFSTLCRYYFSIIVRTHGQEAKAVDLHVKSLKEGWGRLLRQFLVDPTQAGVQCARWFLDESLGGGVLPFHKAWFKTCLLDCPKPRVQAMFASLVLCARARLVKHHRSVSKTTSFAWLRETTQEIAPARGGPSRLRGHESDRYRPRLSDLYSRAHVSLTGGASSSEGTASQADMDDEDATRIALAVTLVRSQAHNGGNGPVAIPRSPVARLLDAAALLLHFIDPGPPQVASLATAAVRIWSHGPLMEVLGVCATGVGSGDGGGDGGHGGPDNGGMRYLLSGVGLVRGALLKCATYYRNSFRTEEAWLNKIDKDEEEASIEQNPLADTRFYNDLVLDTRFSTSASATQAAAAALRERQRQRQLVYASGGQHPMRIAARTLVALVKMLHLQRDPNTAPLPYTGGSENATRENLLMFHANASDTGAGAVGSNAGVAFDRSFVSFVDDNGGTHDFIFGSDFLSALVEGEPLLASRLLRHAVWGSRSRSILLTRRLVSMCIHETHQYCEPSIVRYLQALHLLCRVEADSEHLCDARIEIVLPTVMSRVHRLIDRRAQYDDAFVHAASKMLLQCITRRPHARRILLMGDQAGGDVAIPADWTVWNRLFRRRKKSDDKEQQRIQRVRDQLGLDD